MIKDPTHLIRRNFIQFSKVYRIALEVNPQHLIIISSIDFDVKNFFN